MSAQTNTEIDVRLHGLQPRSHWNITALSTVQTAVFRTRSRTQRVCDREFTGRCRKKWNTL